MFKKYKAIFFDWDGTAVLSRKAPADLAVAAMKPLLQKGIKLVIVSGTTIENIAQGRLEELFTKEELSNLYLGLGRGAYNYAFDDNGKACIFHDEIPDKKTLLDIHRICFEIHQHLLEHYDYATDIVFSRPNYCKIDLMVTENRGTNLFMQENELDMLKETMRAHGLNGGLAELIALASSVGKQYGIEVAPTCDAKYLEVGISSKSDNVNMILASLQKKFGITAEDCAFWGDEYVGIESGIFGSDSFMMTPETKAGDFFDVSEVSGQRPEGVKVLGGGVERFLQFLAAAAVTE
ncbi:MAG: HAD hydrolase family protein [Lachnospiraceae bacterium]|nr:HAD hydrolase family protein [Lachnospiraceae bacterium]